jgi:hypothetical protein
MNYNQYTNPNIPPPIPSVGGFAAPPIYPGSSGTYPMSSIPGQNGPYPSMSGPGFGVGTYPSAPPPASGSYCPGSNPQVYPSPPGYFQNDPQYQFGNQSGFSPRPSYPGQNFPPYGQYQPGFQ